MRDLSTTIGPLTLPIPVLVAAGCGGTGRELRPYADLAALGALTTPSLTAEPRPGGRRGARARVAESPSGLITSAALPNGGVDAFLLRDLPWLAGRGIRTIVSIAGADAASYAEVARRLDGVPGIVAVELNLHADHERIVTAVRRTTTLPVFAKLTLGGAAGLSGSVHAAGAGGVGGVGGVVGVVGAAYAAQSGGADAVTVLNGLPAMTIDPGTLRPVPTGPGALSGPAIHPVAVEAVYAVHEALPGLPIIGTGGVTTGWEALELVLAGASAVGLGTVLLHDPEAAGRITAELAAALETCHLPSLAAAVGRAHHDGPLRTVLPEMETTV